MKITKIELQQALAQRNQQLDVALHRAAQAEADNERLREQLRSVTSVAQALNTMKSIDPVVDARRAALAAARELAMRSGRVTKV